MVGETFGFRQALVDGPAWLMASRMVTRRCATTLSAFGREESHRC